MTKITLGISSCLLGNKVRYDGQGKKDPYITETLGKFFQWLPICPEVEAGLPTPREAMRLVQDGEETLHLLTIKSKIDYTKMLLDWSENKVRSLINTPICGFIFKSRSPSSAIYDAKIYNTKGVLIKKGAGLFGATFKKAFPLIPVIDDGRLQDMALRENFFEKVFCYKRFQEMLLDGGTIKGLIDFHTRHKLILMSHSIKHYSLLGKLLANTKLYTKRELQNQYMISFMEGLSLLATTKKHTNVIMHCMGYFKKVLSADEKAELLEIIEQYRLGLLPLLVPLTLVKHYVRKFNIPYLAQQYYLNPYPLELRLKNHP